MASDRFEKFRSKVIAEPALFARLRETRRLEEFVAAAVAAGDAAGIELGPSEIEREMQDARFEYQGRLL